MSNPSGISPTEYNVLVRPQKVEDKSKGGVILADATLDRKQAFATKGVLVAVSPLAFTYERWPEGETPPQVGDTVIYTKAAGVSVEGVDGEEYKLLKDKDVGAVIRSVSLSSKLKALDADIRSLNVEAANG